MDGNAGLVDGDAAADSIEEQWVRQAQYGDADAWSRLVEEHQQPVFRLAYLLVGDPDDAEDIAQETFVRAYAALDRFRLGARMRPWLLRIAANQARNWTRSVRRRLAVLERVFAGRAHAAPAPEPGSTDAELLWQSILLLGLKDQQVLYLRYFLECSEEEMSVILSVPPGTVKSRLHRALGRLRDRLPAELLPGEEDDHASLQG